MINKAFPPGGPVKAHHLFLNNRLFRGALALLSVLGTQLCAQTIGPDFAGAYTLRDLGVFPNEVSPWGINLKPGNTNVLLFRQEVNFSENQISQITLTRDAAGHFNGYSGASSLFVVAPGGSVDGSLALAPGNVILYTGYNQEFLKEIKAGSANVDKQINLVDLGFGVGGSLAVVPSGFPGAGRLKVLGFGGWFDTALTPDGNGTFDVAAPRANIIVTNSLTGAIYVRAGTLRFTNDTVLTAEEADTTIAAYQLDAFGDPILSSKRSFITGQNVTFTGAVYDPGAKDFLLMGFNRHLYVVVGVSGGTAPTVSITSPASGATFLSNSPFPVSAQATQNSGIISKVVFFQGTNQVGDPSFTPPYSTTAGPLPAGTYALTAVAYDGAGLSATSAVVNITVTDPAANIPPVVSWANPATNTSLVTCSSILLKANCADPDRIGLPMQKVEFFVNGTKLGDAELATYTLLWPDLGVGTYSLTFRATDVDGGVTTSSALTVTVTQPKPNTLAMRFSSLTPPRFPVVCLGGLLGRNYALEVSSNLVDWLVLTNIASTNLVTQYLDTQSTNLTARYFRAKFAP